MSRRIEDMDPAVQERARAAVADLEARGIPHVVFETRRTYPVQHAYWLQSRAPLETVNAARAAAGLAPISEEDNGRPVTWCDGLPHAAPGDGHAESPHQHGRAMDVPAATPQGEPTWDYEGYKTIYWAIAEVMKAHGFASGQDWPPIDPLTAMGKDPDHYEVA